MGIFRKTAFGLDISDTSVKAIELRPKKNGTKVHAYTSFPLPEGVVKNGVVKDAMVLAEELKNGLRPNGKNIFSTESCVFSIPENQAFLDVFELEQDKKSYAADIAEKAQTRFPYAPEKLVYDWDVVAETDEMSDVLVVASERKVINGYVEAIKNAGFNPVLAEPQSLSNTRAALDRSKCEEMSPQVVIDLGAKSSSFTIYDECSVRLSTGLRISGEVLTQEIVDSIGGSFSKAETLKKKHGLSLTVKGKAKKRILQDRIDHAIMHVEDIVTRYENKTNRKIDTIVIIGKTGQLPFLSEYFSKKMKQQVVIADPSREIHNSKVLVAHVKKDSASTSVGLALRSLNPKLDQEINLLKT